MTLEAAHAVGGYFCNVKWSTDGTSFSTHTIIDHKKPRAGNDYKKLITRWDSERELFYDDIVHALQNNNIYGSIAEVCYHAIAKIHC